MLNPSSVLHSIYQLHATIQPRQNTPHFRPLLHTHFMPLLRLSLKDFRPIIRLRISTNALLALVIPHKHHSLDTLANSNRRSIIPSEALHGLHAPGQR